MQSTIKTYKVGDIYYQNNNSLPFAICCSDGSEFIDKSPRFMLMQVELNLNRWCFESYIEYIKTPCYVDNIYNEFESGFLNTSNINLQYNIHNYPAFYVCKNNFNKMYNLKGVNSYLPAIKEIEIMLKNKELLNEKIKQFNTFPLIKAMPHKSIYVSSTQYTKDSYIAATFDKDRNIIRTYPKKSSLYEEAFIRPFIILPQEVSIKDVISENKQDNIYNKMFNNIPTITINKEILKKPEKKKQKKKNKYYIGDIYMLRRKSIDGSQEIIKTFILKKYIYTIKNETINVLICKQIDGPRNNIYTLNKTDCAKYHIKFEPGLQVFPMSMNFINIT